MICCPTSKIAKPDILGAIYRIQKDGSVPHDDPRGLKLDWNRPQVSWLSDERPEVVKRAIDALATANNIAALRAASARIPAVWSLHRISDDRAREAVRDFLDTEDPDTSSAAIHSVALWRDPAALNPLIRLLSHADPQRRRLAAMALGRLGNRDAVEPLLQAADANIDPFLSHAIVYALYEIGDHQSLPKNHPFAKQVHLMRKADQRQVSSDSYPQILPARWRKPDQKRLAQQEKRLDELAAILPNGDPQRGEKLFNDRNKSKCITCHLKGDKGVRLGPDLTWIGAIRSQRDLLEAIVFPSASIARYHEVVNVVTKSGKPFSGLMVKESVDSMFLSTAEGVVQSVAFRDIEEARYSNVSLMPDGLDKLLKPEEIADIVAYLKSSKPQPE